MSEQEYTDYVVEMAAGVKKLEARARQMVDLVADLRRQVAEKDAEIKQLKADIAAIYAAQNG